MNWSDKADPIKGYITNLQRQSPLHEAKLKIARLQDENSKLREYILESNKQHIEELNAFTSRLPVDQPRPFEIIDAVCMKYKISRDYIMANRRSWDVVIPRHHAMYLMREWTRFSFPQIGRLFNRDHSTVLAAIKAHTRRVEQGDERICEVTKSDVKRVSSLAPFVEQACHRRKRPQNSRPKD